MADANPARLPSPSQPGAFLSDSYIFRWKSQSFLSDLILALPVAFCLAVGIAVGHPGGALITAGGAFTAGFGIKHTVDNSHLRPMILVALGMTGSTFVGMVAGHVNLILTLIVALAGFAYGMLSTSQEGISWVGQQCVVALIVASAFPFSPRLAGQRAILILVGGVVQILIASLLLHLLPQLGTELAAIAQRVRQQDLDLFSTVTPAAQAWLSAATSAPAWPYSLRLAVTLALSTGIYRYSHLSNAYWIPMTALLVLEPALADTANRAIARTLGTVLGAVLAGICITHLTPAPLMLAVCIVLFAWLAYATVSVNYALFSVFLTAYIVFLLALASNPGRLVALHRAVSTLIGGALALTVRLIVIRRRDRRLKALPEQV